MLDADLASDRVRAFELAEPGRFVENGIAEQDMVSMAAGMARHGLVPVVNSFASFLARANEQIYNQASERTKVVYAMHYAGLIPAGPGKSHQSLRDASLIAAIPGVTVVHPCNAEETRAVVEWAVLEAPESVAIRLAIGPSPRRIELPAGYVPAPGVGVTLREGSDDPRVVRAVMLHEALTAAELLEGRGSTPRWSRCRGSTVSSRTGSRRRSRASAMSSSSRITRRSARSATCCVALSLHSPSRRRSGWPVSRAGPPAGRRRGAAPSRPRRRLARGARRARPAGSRRHVTQRPVWVVVADPLTARVFFDCGIVDRLAGAPRRPADPRVQLPPRRVGEWAARAGRRPRPP